MLHLVFKDVQAGTGDMNNMQEQERSNFTLASR